MLLSPMDVAQQFPVRKTKQQKTAFRDAVCEYVKDHDYPVTVEAGSFGARNIVIGDPEKAKYLVTAHYDTPAVLPIPNFITPCSFLPFLMYQFAITLLMVLVMLLGAALVSFALVVPAGFFLTDGQLDAWSKVASFLAGYGVLIGIMAMMLIGPANKNNANDNTSGVVTLLEILRTMPENQRHKVCFVLFDLEEAGLIGSAAYRKAHRKASDNQIVLNLDCVGDGDHIRLFPTKKLKKDRKKLTALYAACGYPKGKDILVHEKGFSYYPSDQKHFPYGVGICALRKAKFGLYISRIHTKKDTILDQTNVNLLRAALTTYICRDAAQ